MAIRIIDGEEYIKVSELSKNGWVKDFPHWLADMPEDKVDAFCKMKGYIKLSDVELCDNCKKKVEANG